MHKMNNKLGAVMMLGAAGVGMYLLVNKKMPKMKQKVKDIFPSIGEDDSVNFN